MPDQVTIILKEKLYENHIIRMCEKGGFYFIVVDKKQAYPGIVFSDPNIAHKYYNELKQRIIRKSKYVSRSDSKYDQPWTWLYLKAVDEIDEEEYRQTMQTLLKQAAERKE